VAYSARPTFRRSILGQKLMKAREAKGLTVEQVAEKARCSPAAIYRQESGHTAVKVTMVPFYAKTYEVSSAEEARWDEWARRAKEKGAWASSGSKLGPSHQDYADAETLAEELRIWQGGVIPGLLQTKPYSEAVIRVAATVRPGETPSDEDEVNEALALREHRKELLSSDKVPRIWAVIGEAAIRTPPYPGADNLLAEQIQRLLNLGETKATIQVLPMASGLHVATSGSFTILSLDMDGTDVVFREGYGDGSFQDEEERVRSYKNRYERLQSQALSIAKTRQFLHDILDSLNQG
jgi:transcriptional regulator with XRE-family HTH domain